MFVFSTSPLPLLSTTPKWLGRGIGDYYYYNGGPEKGWDFLDYSVFDKTTRQKTIETTEVIDHVISFLGLFLNFIHFFVLTRKELRSAVVFILMIGICLSDILVSSSSITERVFSDSAGRFWDQGKCGTHSEQQWWYSFIELVSQGIQKFGKLTSALLTLFMAIIRTVSVIFPMSSFSNSLAKARTGITIGINTFLLCFIWCVQYYKNYKFEKVQNDARSCYVISQIQNMSVIVEGYALITLTVIYMLVTGTLLIALRVVRRKQKRLGTSKSDNTSMLVLTMAVLFFFSQLFFSIFHILGFKDTWTVDLTATSLSEMFQYAARIVLTMNSILHCIICFCMSSQYRAVVKNLIKFDKWRGVTIITETSTNPNGATDTRSGSY